MGVDHSYILHYMQEKITQEKKSALQFLGKLELKMLIADPQ